MTENKNSHSRVSDLRHAQTKRSLNHEFSHYLLKSGLWFSTYKYLPCIFIVYLILSLISNPPRTKLALLIDFAFPALFILVLLFYHSIVLHVVREKRNELLKKSQDKT